MFKSFIVLLMVVAFILDGCASVPTNTAYVLPKVLFEDSAICKDITKMRTTSDPKEETHIFSSEDQQAVMWIKLGNIAGTHRLKWEWFDPSGHIYLSSGDYTVNKDGKSRPYNTSWHKMAIKDEKAAALPGTWRVEVFLNNKLAAIQPFEIIKICPFLKPVVKSIKTTPDVHKWAIVMGIDKYSKSLPARFSETDANIMKDIFMTRAGIPGSNVFLFINETASKGDIKSLLKDKLKKQIENKDTLYFYYSGHGILHDSAPYLDLYDGDPNSPGETAYSVEDLYKDFDQLQAKNVIVFLDTCFWDRIEREKMENMAQSGGTDALEVRYPLLSSHKVIAFSTAKTNQLSTCDQAQGHGLFTYYLLKGLLGEADENRDGRIQMGELVRYIEQEAASASQGLLSLMQQQNPVAMPKLTEDMENLEVVSIVK